MTKEQAGAADSCLAEDHQRQNPMVMCKHIINATIEFHIIELSNYYGPFEKRPHKKCAAFQYSPYLDLNTLKYKTSKSYNFLIYCQNAENVRKCPNIYGDVCTVKKIWVCLLFLKICCLTYFKKNIEKLYCIYNYK